MEADVTAAEALILGPAMTMNKPRRGARVKIVLPKDLIKRFRKTYDITQGELAERMEVAELTVRRAENSTSVSTEFALSLGDVITNTVGDAFDLRKSTDLIRLEKLLDEEGPTFPGSPSKSSIFPYRATLERNVIGREKEVSAIREALNNAKIATLTSPALLVGMGGIGKSALARLFANCTRNEYKHVWWVRANNQTELIADLYDLGLRLSLFGANLSEKLSGARMTVTHLEKSNEPWLLIFDNARNQSVIDGFVPFSSNVHVLVTSRDRAWTARHRIVDVASLDYQSAESNAVKLLLQEAGREDDLHGALALSHELAGLPLAIVCAGGLLRNHRDVGYTGYLHRLKKILNFLPPDIGDYDRTVFGSILLSIEQLSAEARGLLSVLSVLDPNTISTSLFSASKATKTVTTSDDDLLLTYPFSDKYELLDIELWFSELERYSLLRQNSDFRTYSMHRIVQSVARQMTHSELEQVMGTASVLIARQYPVGMSAPQFRENWASCEKIQPHTEALRVLGAKSAAFGFAANQANRYLDTRRQDFSAIRMVIASIKARRLTRGGAALEVGEGYHNLAISLWRLSRMKSATDCAQKAVENWHGSAEPRDFITLSVRLSVLGICQEELAKTLMGDSALQLKRQAKQAKQKALCLSRRHSGMNSLTLAIRLNNLGNHRQWSGQHGAALRLHFMALKVRDRVLEDAEPEKAHGPWLLGKAMLDAGLTEVEYRGFSAVDLLERALKLREDCFADQPEHPDIIRTAKALLECRLLQTGARSDEANAERIIQLRSQYRS